MSETSWGASLRFMMRVRVLLLLVFLSATLGTACALPGGDDQTPEGAYYLWVQARQAGDIDGCWRATHPEVQSLLGRWHQAESDTLFKVTTMYPEARRASALEVLEEGGRARLPDPKALFAHLLTRGSGEALAGLQLLGARTSSVTVSEDNATLLTLGGDTVTVRRFGERWAVSLAEDERSALEALAAKAESNFRRAESNVKRLRGVDQSEQSESPTGQ
mgnify:CR=1 FL=1